MTNHIDLPEQPELMQFDFHGQCKAWRMPDGTIAIVDRNLKVHLVYAPDFYGNESNLEVFLEKVLAQKTKDEEAEEARYAQPATVAG